MLANLRCAAAIVNDFQLDAGISIPLDRERAKQPVPPMLLD
jgi:hypothetical protein